MARSSSLRSVLLLVPSVALAAHYEAPSNNNGNNIRLSLKNGRASQCQGLWAKNGALQVGNVCVEPDRRNSDHVIVAFSTADTGWRLEETQLWIGAGETSVEDLPSLVEDDALSQFPYVKEDLQGEHLHFGFVVKLSELDFICPNTQGTQFTAVAHATVSAPRSGLRHTTGEAIETTKASAWASFEAPVVSSLLRTKNGPTLTTSEVPSSENETIASFDFTLVCDLIAERPKDAPERHHANYVPS